MAGDRLPSPPRERKPALAALAALLVLVGALGAALLVMRAGDRIEAIQITADVSAGQPIPDDAMRPVMVADNTDVAYVEWSQKDQLAEEDLRAKTDLVDGAVLVGPMLSEKPSLPEGEVVVGVTLQPGQYPPSLEQGDRIDAYWVGDEATEEDPETGTTPDARLAVGALVAQIHGEEEADGNSALALRLRVDAAEAQDLTRAASNGEVTVVIVGEPDAD
ncbi:hypothetical protein [Streptomyces sp. B6B3]|uniref:hypothetical protein n=1 Tax=Streptomyces sp. B6B3 TaxID=3153570 RepID=UPI00325EA034